MADITKPQGASLPEMFQQMSELLGGEYGKYQNAMSAAQAITPIDSSILQSSLAQGGPLSTAQDFATSNAWAMTPEMFRQTMQSRPDVSKQIGEVTSLSDAIFGRSNQRKAAEQVAQAQLNLGKDALSMAQRGYENQVDRITRQQESQADRALRESQFARDLDFREKDAASRRGLEQQRIDLERKRLMKLTEPGSGIDTSTLPLVDRDRALKFDAAAMGYVDKSGKIKAGQEVNYWNNRLASDALTTNLQSGSIKNIPGYRLSNGQDIKSAAFVRTPYGGEWYGVLGKDKDGKTLITQNPLTVVEHPALRQLRRNRGGQVQAPVYAD